MLDFLIIGQGLAGSLLARELIGAGQKLLVLDNGHRHSSSRVAAGLINPVTGLRLVKSPYTEVWLEAARDCYRKLEKDLGVELLYDKPMWRLFTDQRQRENWQQRLQETGYEEYLSAIDEHEPDCYKAPFGHGVVAHTGYVDTKALLETVREWLRRANAYQEQEVDYEAIAPFEDYVDLHGLKARRLIFCEGYRGVDNPWFAGLPLTPVKGEILTLRHQDALPDAILNFGKWLLPIAADRFKLGATYDWEHRDQEVTEEARDHLLQALNDIMKAPIETRLEDHEAGLRPNTRDRLPLIGPHSEYEPLYLFNGFGSKGSLMIPFYARHLAEHLLKARPLQAHCRLERFQDSA